MLTGDIERAAERGLLRRYQPERLRSDVMLIPHHGSRTSSLPDFVAATSPAYALVSAACGNRFRLPKHDIITRYVRRNAAILSTADAGMVELSLVAGQDITQSSYRRRTRRVWQQWPCGE